VMHLLAELSIINFAIIEKLNLSFQKGLTVITGETGAGKSIIIDAISLIIGGRSSSEYVRHDTERAEIEGLFLVDQYHPIHKKTEEFGIDTSDGMVVLHRTISKSGRSVCRINGKLMTLAILREVGRVLIDIHGQHEHQDLMHPERHLLLLDGFGGAPLHSALTEYRKLHQQYSRKKQQLKQLTENEKEMAHRLDLIQYQLKEISKAELEPDEEERLMDEKMQLSNYEKIFTALQDGYHALYGDHKGLDWVGLAMNHLQEIADIDDDLKEKYETVANSFYLLEETTFSLRDHFEGLEFEPDRLNIIEERLNEIQHLKRKYGQSIPEITEYAAAIEDEIDKIKNRDQHVADIEKELDEITKDLIVEAKTLSDVRRTTAKKLTGSIQCQLEELYMKKTLFDVHFHNKNGKAGRNGNFQKDGIDDVEFMISTNPGEPLKPLSKVASGGELSRIMLALKTILSQGRETTSIIFDEVDTGVSGRVAQSMAEKIFKLSVSSQVYCITHLPQVAAMADQHLYISKQEKRERTQTNVISLSKSEKIKEIGRMISSVEITDLTKKHAQELLELAEHIKTTS
jgi:DNA repair protein RecN (Recombination protein N)